MKKAELIDRVASSAHVPKTQASNVVDAIFGVIKESLTEGDNVTITGFGTFKVTHRAARTGRNPQTGESIKIAAQKKPHFSASKQLKEACNHK